MGAIDTFNTGPKCVGLVVKPCCLPPMDYVKSKTRWSLGAHSFCASEVCMWGKYNKNQWQGPQKASLASRFRNWSDNLFRGVLADGKSCDHVPLVEGHYQDTYIFAERTFSDDVPSLPEEQSDALLVKQVLDVTNPWDVLGLQQGVSMRTVYRRFAGLSKALGEKMADSSEAEDAFRRVKIAVDAVRAQR